MISIVMGSYSDWDTMKEGTKILDRFSVPYEKKIVSAHRSPELLYEFSKSARERGISIIIAGAGGAAHLPGMIASLTTLPVLGVPIQTKSLSGLDSLYSIVQMPAGVPVGTLAIGSSGAVNAALLALRMLSTTDENITKKLEEYRIEIRENALSKNGDLV